MEMKYSHGTILLAIFLGCLQICNSNRGVTDQDEDCMQHHGYLSGNYYGTSPTCKGHNPNHYDGNPNDGTWDKYYFSYGRKGMKPYDLSHGKHVYGSSCWSGNKYKECFAYYDVHCATMCSKKPGENWNNYTKFENNKWGYQIDDIMGYVPPGLFPIHTGQYRLSNLFPHDFDWPYIVGATVVNGAYKTPDGKQHSGNYVNYCWCNFPQLHYDGPKYNTTITGAKAVNMTEPQYNINSLKSAMDWCSSEPMSQCQAVLAQRIHPNPLQFLAMKTDVTAASTLGINKTAEEKKETYEYSYVRQAAPNSKATVTNRTQYIEQWQKI